MPNEEIWSVAEVQIHPTTTWNATASLNNDAAREAIDNDPATSWTTDQPQTPDMWFQLDLGRIESVTGVRLVPPDDEIPRGFRVSVWNQQIGGWQKIAERKDNREDIDISFAPVMTQYINVHLLQEAEKPWAIREAFVTIAMTGWIGPNSG